MRHQACELAIREAVTFSLSGHVEYFRNKDWIWVCNVIGFENIRIRPSTRFQILSVFKNFHSGEWIQKVVDSHTGLLDTFGQKANPQRKSYGFKNIRYVWTGPQFSLCNCIVRQYVLSKAEIKFCRVSSWCQGGSSFSRRQPPPSPPPFSRHQPPAISSAESRGRKETNLSCYDLF